MVKKILITGANGYIGTVLAGKLLRKGYHVVGIDSDYFKPVTLGRYKNKYKTIRQDVRHTDKINLNNIDCIIHLAALSNDPMGAIDEQLTYEINYKATIALAKKAKQLGVKRFIFSSSCSVYGIAKEETVNEKSTPNPLTMYAKSKIAAEKELAALADNTFCVCLLRNSTVYGHSPRFRNDLVVNNLLTCGVAMKKIAIMSDGTPWRPLIDVRDLSDIFIRFITVAEKKVNGKIINIGFKENNVQVKDILKIIQKYLKDCEVIFTGEHGKDSRSYKVNFDKLHNIFPGLKQSWTIDRSVAHLLRQLKKTNYKKKDFTSERFSRLNKLKELLTKNKIDDALFWK